MFLYDVVSHQVFQPSNPNYNGLVVAFNSIVHSHRLRNDRTILATFSSDKKSVKMYVLADTV